MKAAIYTRVSTDNQAEVKFNSCETQELKIRSFIKSQNDIEVYKVYSDQGWSGANIERPALKNMLCDIHNGVIDTVIAYKIDRLTRSPKDFYQLIEIFEKNNVSFVSVTERFDTSTPSGRLLRNIMLTFAQFERELISERIRDKILERAKKGMWSRGAAPFGYKKEDKNLVIEPKEAEIVRKMFEIFVKNRSICKTFHELKAKKMFSRSDLPLSKTSISSMLDGIVYTGMIKHKENIYKGIHEPIISKELFEEVQAIRKDKFRPKRSMSYNYSLFPGLIQCKECGSTMCATFTNKLKHNKRTRYFYYRCSSIEKRDRTFCSIRQVSADRLDKFIVDNLDKISKNKQYLDSLIYMLNHNSQDRLNGFELKGVRSERMAEILQNIAKAARLKGKTEKRIIMRRHIEKVIYSKETIEVKILYSESVDIGLAAADNRNRAACQQLSSLPTRPSKKIVRRNVAMGPVGFEPTTCRL
ncbi:recombinase family protein [Candidatus Margulisiibacteriota bacterium]